MQTPEVRLAAVLSAQLLDFDRLFEKGAEGALGLLDRVGAIVVRCCNEHRGRVVRSVRDSYLAEFPTAVEAVSCAMAIEAAADEIARGQEDRARMAIGVHIGDVHFFENDAAGETVAIASRLRAKAHPGAIAMSGEVYDNVADKLSLAAKRGDDLTMEGSRRTVRLYEIDRSGTGETAEAASCAAAAEGGSRDSAADPADFDELKAFVLKQIKRVGQRLSTEKIRRMVPSRSPELDAAIEKLADMGFLSRGEPATQASPRLSGYRGSATRLADREAWREARRAIRQATRQSRHEYHHAYRHPPHPPHPFEEDSLEEADFAAYRERTIERAHRAVGGFVGHLAPFLVVNGFLFFINLSTGFAFPWFLFPLGGWAIGLISHFTTVGTARRERAEVEALPETLAEEDYRLLRRFHKARGSLRATLASTLSVAAFLLMINLIVSPSFLWALFPIAGLFIAIVSTLGTYLSRRGGFRKRLNELFHRKGGSSEAATTKSDPSDSPEVRQALTVVDSILEQAKRLDPNKAYLGEDLEPLLGNYIDQIRGLTRRKREVEEIMAAVPRAELAHDLDALRQRYERAQEGPLKREYHRSIEQIERQNRSFAELEDQKELLDLRVTGSLNSLKQMQIDLARVGGVTSKGDLDSVDRLREKSRELSEYLHDLGESYEELESLRGSGEEERRRVDRLLAELKEQEERPPETI